jgi:hypothetical protein
MARVGASAGWKDNYVETVTASQTLSYNDSGKVLLVGTDALTVTLPATKAGIRYTFINSGADEANIITISPNASDKIIGSIANAAADSVCSASDDGDLVNTKGTSNKGDRVTLVGDGSDGWYIVEGVGIWVGS